MIATNRMMTARQLPEEFEALFREHSDFVYRTAYRVTGSETDAEDIVQSLFLKLMRQPLSADIQSKPRAYLYRAAVNTALNLVRSRKHEVLTSRIDDFESPVRWQEPGRELNVHQNAGDRDVPRHPMRTNPAEQQRCAGEFETGNTILD